MDLLKQAIKEIQNGEDKDKIYEKYKDKVDKETLASKIAFYPDIELSEKYKKKIDVFNLILIVYSSILFIIAAKSIIITGLNLTQSLSSIVKILIQIIVLYAVTKKHFLAYRFVLFLCSRQILGILEKIKLIINTDVISIILVISIFSTAIVLVFLSININKMVYPHMKFIRPKYHEAGGVMYKYYPEEKWI